MVITNKDKTYLQDLGARILSEANDLKRTPEALAREIGWDPEELRQLIQGKGDADKMQAVMKDMVATYPIAFSDIWLEPDDTDEGVLVMRSEESLASSRVFERKNRSAGLSPYYEYRDTAMSRTAPYKPEWIKELRVVEDTDPENPDVIFNNGHLMHQLTFFIGEVNFYWISDGEKFCRKMNTGDSCYITPFVPHSFTARDPSQPGLIIAVTFGGAVRKASGALSRLTPEDMEAGAGDVRDPKSVFTARLDRYRTAESLSVAELSQHLQSEGMKPKRADQIAAGEYLPSDAEIQLLAEALEIRESDLAVYAMSPEEEVTIKHRADTLGRPHPNSNRPACTLTPLVRTRFQPGLRGFAIEFLESDALEVAFDHWLHEYVYNYGNKPVELKWGGHKKINLNPGDSAYIRPCVKHSFSGQSEATIAVARIPGELTDNVFDELATFETTGRVRVAREVKQWF